MNRSSVVIGVALLVFALVALSSPQTEIKKVPLKYTNPSSGQAMYAAYCAVCHGVTGKGNGPAAPSLSSMPSDLTLLSKDHGGKFPWYHVNTVIRGDTNLPAEHRQKEMPVWSALFRRSCPGTIADLEIHQRASNLTNYLESLQRK